jgi:tetratricopeptide (TPR) repeat protein/TolB-like protein
MSFDYDAFLSYSRADWTAVELIARRLVKERGLRVFVDKWSLVPGARWQDELEQALDRSSACVVFIGPGGPSPWSHVEMRAALELRVNRRMLRVVPVLLPGADATVLSTLPLFLKAFSWVDFRAGINDEAAFKALKSGIEGTAPDMSEDLGTPLISSQFPSWLKWAVALTFLVLVIAFIGLTRFPVRPVVRRSVAVLGFKNLSERPEADWISTAITDMFAGDLSQGSALRVIPEDDVARMKLDLRLTNLDTLAPETLASVRRNSGSDFVILGSYLDSGGAPAQLKLNWRMQDTIMGNTVVEWSGNLAESELRQTVEVSAKEIFRHFELKLSKGQRPSLPDNKEFLRSYSQGLAELRRFNARSAKDDLVRAVLLDPQNFLARANLASAWAALGYEANAKDEAKIAFQLSQDLDHENQLLAQGQYYEFSFDWDDAIKAYRELVESFPDNIDYRLGLADLQIDAAVPQEALETLVDLHRLPPADRGDPRIEIEKAEAEEELADFSGMLQAAAASASKGKDQGASLLLAKALDLKGTALWRLGNPAAGEDALREAKTIYLSEGNRNGVAQELFGLARIARNTNNFESALDLYQRSLSTYQEYGNKGGAAECKNGLGLVQEDQGDLAGAKRTLMEALALAQEISNRRAEAQILGNLGNVATDAGELALAGKYHSQSISAYREIGDKSHLANELNDLSALLVDEGDLEEARKLEEEALSKARAVQDKKTEAYILSATGEILTQEGDLEDARTDHEAALALWKQLGRKVDAAYDSASLARLVAEQGQPQQAERPLRDAITVFQEHEETEDELAASGYLIDSLLDQGKVREAEVEARRVSRVAAKSQLPIAQFRALISVALADAEAGNRTKSLRDLKIILDKARKAAYVRLELEARYAIGKVESKSNPALAKSDLDRLVADANARGFQLIASKAIKIGARPIAS